MKKILMSLSLFLSINKYKIEHGEPPLTLDDVRVKKDWSGDDLTESDLASIKEE